MKFSYNWLKTLIGLKESPEKLGEFLTMRAFEVEEIKRVGEDWAIDVKLPANRYTDASGHMGLAKEIAALKKLRIKNTESGVIENKKTKASDFLKVTVENSTDCPRYTARVMVDIKIGLSPEWLKERLETCGLQSINNVVDAANYVMLETGQPMHVFDYEKITGKKIIVRRGKTSETLEGLDDKKYELNPESLVIADEKEPMAIAGIKGGKDSGVSEKTHTIVLESANFYPAGIRRASQILNLKTDASIRFEHGLDPNQTEVAIERLSSLIQQIAGGEIVGGRIDVYPKPVRPKLIMLRPSYANGLLGKGILLAQYPTFLKQLGFLYKKKGENFLVQIPTNRLDLTIEEDLIEEVGRMLGYDNIAPKTPESILIAPKKNDEWFWENEIKDFLAGAGFTESLLYEFTGDKELDQFFSEKNNLVELENPTSPETKYLVPRILIKYAVSAAQNLRDFDYIKIFGVGKSFSLAHEVSEKKDLIIAYAKKGASGEEEFYSLKGTVDQLLESLGISDHWYDDATKTNGKKQETRLFHPHRFAEIKIVDEKIGVIGELHPAVLENIKAKARIIAAEIDFEKLWKLARAEAEFKPIGKYPAVMRDLAVIVPAQTKTMDVENIIENSGGELLIDADLFDYFQNDDMREAKEKSLAFHLVFQSPERTLKDEEVDKLIEKIIKALEEKDWEIKK